MKQVNQVKLGKKFLLDTAHRTVHDRCLWEARMRRDKKTHSIPDWEEMRCTASEIKRHVLSHLDEYLVQFEENATRNGIHVHWASTPEEHNRIVLDIFRSHNVKTVTKAKSMTQDECQMRQYLAENGIDVFEADLGERIQQLDNQRPSHIVMPAIHKLRTDVAKLFAEKLGSDPDNDNPEYLNSVMRADMRRNYIKVDAGMTGVNFALAETGGIVVCTNEGNADISVATPPLLVSTMGLEKIIPGKKELALFIRMLSRNALGYDMTQFTTHIHGPLPGQEMHIVILDNGRSSRLGEDYWEVLKCIRCGACMNTCPVFRRTSGISYDAPYMGPIGEALQPSYDLYLYAQLPYSCTQCASCGDICPVKVPLPELIIYWRNRVVEKGYELKTDHLEMDIANAVLKNPSRFVHAEKIGLLGLKMINGMRPVIDKTGIAKYQFIPDAPKETFRQYYKRHSSDDEK